MSPTIATPTFLGIDLTELLVSGHTQSFDLISPLDAKVSKQEEENGFYHREYPNQSQQFGIVEGYLSDVYGSNGIESFYNDILSGTANSPKL